MTASFDVVSEPWIPVVDLDGAAREVSLRDVLLDGHNLRRIVGQTPPMTAALYRIVLAVLHRAYGPADEEAWKRLWSDAALPKDELTEYFDQHPDRFDLFHSTYPFLQCAQLSSVKTTTVAKLVPHLSVGNNVTLFDHTTAQDVLDLSPGEATRWLVTAHAFDPGGTKTPYHKVKSSKAASCSGLGVVLVEGATLKDTLLLNALRYSPEVGKPHNTFPADAPAWEGMPAAPEPDERQPDGWTDLLTWQSRRILLFPTTVDDRTVVRESVMAPGSRMTSEIAEVEMMAAYRKPTTANGKPKADAPLLPIRLRPVRGVWRHSVELLLVDTFAEENSRQRPRALKQIADRVVFERVPADAVYTLRIFGQQLDKNASVVEGYLEEEVPAPLALVRAQDKALAGLLGCTVELADEAGAALRSMQREYLKDLRAEPSDTLDIAYWPELAAPFATFLREVNAARLDAKSEAPATRTWARAVRVAAESASERWADGTASADRNLSTVGKHQGVFLQRLTKHVNTFHAKATAYLSKDEDQ
ncbi:type I-E CRISPR-associated protein Cse1/CasA [Umezawaea sp. NPDC059074]|uniref:type I-E CRISPR-associated protein Cse1/CasA n=1 Tax=Umezawaea sp. NPDC059074 TaxID=3346716 RepID=UPI0036D04B6B